MFVDGTIAEREEQFVDALQSALAIDDEMAMKIVEALLIARQRSAHPMTMYVGSAR